MVVNEVVTGTMVKLIARMMKSVVFRLMVPLSKNVACAIGQASTKTSTLFLSLFINVLQSRSTVRSGSKKIARSISEPTMIESGGHVKSLLTVVALQNIVSVKTVKSRLLESS